MENEDCNSVYGIINGGHLCTDSVGGHGVCNVSIYLQLDKEVPVGGA